MVDCSLVAQTDCLTVPCRVELFIHQSVWDVCRVATDHLETHTAVCLPGSGQNAQEPCAHDRTEPRCHLVVIVLASVARELSNTTK